MKKIYKSSLMTERLVPKYTQSIAAVSFWNMPYFMWQFYFSGFSHNAPDVNIYESPEKTLNYLALVITYLATNSKYNFQNINDILRNSTGVYSREEGGYGLFPNISLRGASSLRSAAVTMLEDGINIAPAPYSAPDAYYSPLAAKMHAIEVLKGSSQFRYGPHTTGGVINYQTTQ